MGGVATSFTLGTLMTSAAADVINHNGCKNQLIQTYAILLCKDDIGSIVEPTSSVVWALILTDFQRVISRYLQDISTYRSCTAQRVLRTIFMQKSKAKYAYLPSKIIKVWIPGVIIYVCRYESVMVSSVHAHGVVYDPTGFGHVMFDRYCMWLTSLYIYKL